LLKIVKLHFNNNKKIFPWMIDLTELKYD